MFDWQPCTYSADLMNLLNNAVKYNRRGGRVWLRCREIADRPDRSWFEFVCEDTGIGMSEAYQQHIFEPFSQESDGVKSKYDGTVWDSRLPRE